MWQNVNKLKAYDYFDSIKLHLLSSCVLKVCSGSAADRQLQSGYPLHRRQW